MLPRPHRLREYQAFHTTYRCGHRQRGRHLTLFAWQKPRGAIAQPTQIGIVISRKVSKRAVDRNRIKRQLRAVLCAFLPHLRQDWWLVVVVHPSAVRCSQAVFLPELEQLLAERELLDGYS